MKPASISYLLSTVQFVLSAIAIVVVKLLIDRILLHHMDL